MNMIMNFLILAVRNIALQQHDEQDTAEKYDKATKRHIVVYSTGENDSVKLYSAGWIIYSSRGVRPQEFTQPSPI